MGPSVSLPSFVGSEPHIPQLISISHIMNVRSIAVCSAISTAEPERRASEGGFSAGVCLLHNKMFYVSYDE